MIVEEEGCVCENIILVHLKHNIDSKSVSPGTWCYGF